MEVIVAKNSGFCFGVKRAVDMVYSQIGHGNIYTFGPVIHNEEVIKDLENKGVKVINSVEEAADVPKGTVIIRAHGVPAHIYREILSLGHKVVDATCPFVLKIHNIVKEAAAKGEFVVIIDDVEKMFFRFFEKTSLRTCIGHRERIVGVDKNPGSGRCGQSFSFRVEIGGSKSDDDTA